MYKQHNKGKGIQNIKASVSVSMGSIPMCQLALDSAIQL